MHDARDAVDARLIAAGDPPPLLPTRLPPGHASPVPVRAGRHKGTGWLVRAHLRGDDVRLVPLDEDWDVPVEPVLEGGEELDSLLAELTPGERDVFELRCFHDLSASEGAGAPGGGG